MIVNRWGDVKKINNFHFERVVENHCSTNTLQYFRTNWNKISFLNIETHDFGIRSEDKPLPEFNLHEFVPPPEKWKEITRWSPLPEAGWRQLFLGILRGEHADFDPSIRAEFMRDLATRLLLPSPSLDTPLPSPWRKPLCGPCTAACMIIVFLSACSCTDGYLPSLLSLSRLDIHVMLRCQHGPVGSGRVGLGWVLRWNAAGLLSLSLSLENAQGCRGCLMVLRERRSGLEGWLGERRCGFEARLHEGCDGCVLSRSAISRDSAIVQFEDSKKCNNWRGVVGPFFSGN